MQPVKGTTAWLVFALSMLLYSVGHAMEKAMNKGGGSMNKRNTNKASVSRLGRFGTLVVSQTAWAVLTSFVGGSLLP